MNKLTVVNVFTGTICAILFGVIVLSYPFVFVYSFKKFFVLGVVCALLLFYALPISVQEIVTISLNTFKAMFTVYTTNPGAVFGIGRTFLKTKDVIKTIDYIAENKEFASIMKVLQGLKPYLPQILKIVQDEQMNFLIKFNIGMILLHMIQKNMEFFLKKYMNKNTQMKVNYVIQLLVLFVCTGYYIQERGTVDNIYVMVLVFIVVAYILYGLTLFNVLPDHLSIKDLALLNTVYDAVNTFAILSYLISY